MLTIATIKKMRLLGNVNETLSFDEWEKKHCKWLK